MDKYLAFILNTYTNNLPETEGAYNNLKNTLLPYEPYATKALQVYPLHATSSFFDMALVFKLIKRFFLQDKKGWPIDEHEAYKQLQLAIRLGDIDKLSLPVKLTVDSNGGFAYFRQSSNQVADRSNFKNSYKTILDALLTKELEGLINV